MDRIDPAVRGSEEELLCSFLDYHRATFHQKVEGLDRDKMATQLRTSNLTLAGLTKHLALVEDSWFQDRFLGEGKPEPWASAPFGDDPDWEFHSAVDEEPEALLALYDEACARSRRVVAHAGSLDELSAKLDHHSGEHFSLRWILLHMIEETARHNGHADLLREAIDGSVGE